tara:strand:+ start:360 stop:533 length:174 start_codon:yes stop_codon:yes gene_type:complete
MQNIKQYYYSDGQFFIRPMLRQREPLFFFGTLARNSKNINLIRQIIFIKIRNFLYKD